MRLIYKFSVCVILVLGFSFEALSQVSIGSLEPPVSGALLQMKEVDPHSNNNQTVLDKGVLLPRVKLESTTSLEPAVSITAGDYDKLKILHVGMMVFNLTDNSSGLQRGAYIWTGSEWQYMLTISDNLNLDVNPKEIVIGSGLDLQIIEDLHIDAIWNPESNNCLVELKDILNGGIKFEDSFALPTSLSGGSGVLNILSQNIKPLSPNEITSNPFFERRSTLNLTVSDASSSKTEVVTLRQLHYKLLVEGYKGKEHELGNTYSLKIRSNGAWKATITGESGLIESFQPANHVEDAIGAEFSYTLSDNDTYEGKEAIIIFSSVDGKFSDQTFVVKGVREYPNSYFVKPGVEFNIPINKAYQFWEGLQSKPITGTLSAELLWQDRKDLIVAGGVVLDKSDPNNVVIKVHTNSGRTTEELKEYTNYPIDLSIITSTIDIPYTGNAVIALKENGVIRWSWHLWITDYNPNEALDYDFATGVSELKEVTGGRVYSYYNSSENFVLMDRTIGSTSVDIRTDRIKGTVFQWGRKDPLTGPKQRTNTPRDIYDINNVLLVENTNGFMREVVSDITGDYLEKSIENPMTIYAGNNDNSYDWYGALVGFNNDFLWCTPEGKKTLYDPCPRGWRVPEGTYELKSPWYNLEKKGVYDLVSPSAVALDYRPNGFGIMAASAVRAQTTGTLQSGRYEWHGHGKIVSPLAYLAQMESTLINPALPKPRATGAPIRCIRDENARK